MGATLGRVLAVLLGALVGLAWVPSAAAVPPSGSQDARPLLVVLDASGSMLRRDAGGRTRMAAAKQAIGAVVTQVPRRTPLGLRVFGTGGTPQRSRAACTDSRLRVPIRVGSARRVAARVQGVRARGWTPIGHALRSAGRDLRRAQGGFGTVVLVSDGVDECYPRFGPDPCTVADSMTSTALRLRVHTVGFSVDRAARRQLTCIARVTGGTYSDAGDARSLADALRRSLAPRPEPRAEPEPPPRPVRATPPEPAAPRILRTVGAAVALLALVGGSVALVRALLRRRRRRYW